MLTPRIYNAEATNSTTAQSDAIWVSFLINLAPRLQRFCKPKKFVTLNSCGLALGTRLKCTVCTVLWSHESWPHVTHKVTQLLSNQEVVLLQTDLMKPMKVTYLKLDQVADIMDEVTLLLGNSDWITHPLSVLQYTCGHEIRVGKACSSWTARMP